MSNYGDNVNPILKEAGKELLKHHGKIEYNRKSASPADLVTSLDTDTELFLKKELEKIYPDIGFYGEEFGGEEKEKFWLVDPIDGTAHYVRGLPFCTTMIALIDNHQPVFSSIYSFVSGDMYSAEKGKGATKNGEPIHVSDRKLNDTYISFEVNTNVPGNLDLWRKLRTKTIYVHTISCGFEFSMIAEGKLDGRIQKDPWGGLHDFAAGAFLVQEAGGVVANIGKRDYDYRDMNSIVTNKAIFKELTEGVDAIFPIEE